MIKLKNDSLSFSFPEIDEAIRRLIEEHINSTLPAIIAADRTSAVHALRSSWRFREADWDLATTSRCFVHLCNSLMWRQITGSNPPHPPFTAKEYDRAGVPWFDCYRDDLSALSG